MTLMQPSSSECSTSWTVIASWRMSRRARDHRSVLAAMLVRVIEMGVLMLCSIMQAAAEACVGFSNRPGRGRPKRDSASAAPAAGQQQRCPERTGMSLAILRVQYA